MFYLKTFIVFIGVYLHFSVDALGQNNGCVKAYSDLAINGNDLKSVQGRSSSCCQYCQQTQGCHAYTWDSSNGGTCWLKNAPYPLYKQTGSFTGVLSPDSTDTYVLRKNYAGPSFFDDWLFRSNSDNYTFSYTNESLAKELGLIGFQNGKVYMGVDYTNIVSNTSKTGRLAVSIESKTLYNSGLFILSLEHIPTGPGTHPAFWTTGNNWPYNGEIDILEAVDPMIHDQITLHTGENCKMHKNDSFYFTGNFTDKKIYTENKEIIDCYQYSNSSQNVSHGCAVRARNGTFNTLFNEAGGGVYVLQWDRENFLRIWIFVKPDIPEDIVRESPNPNPDTWGMPTFYLPMGTNSSCPGDHFNNHTVIFSNYLCGSWVDEFFPGGEQGCENTVRNYPQEYKETYWLINYLKIFCKPGEPCGYDKK